MHQLLSLQDKALWKRQFENTSNISDFRQLELNEFVTNANVGHQVYDLIGVVNHYGGLGGGHYTAYCKHEPSGTWYDYDDSRVSQLGGGEESVKVTKLDN